MTAQSNEQVAANLEEMRRECAAARQEAETRMRQLLDATDEVIRRHGSNWKLRVI